jgi:hypothetical protein
MKLTPSIGLSLGAWIARLFKRAALTICPLALTAVVGWPIATISAEPTECASRPQAHLLTTYGPFVADQKHAAAANTATLNAALDLLGQQGGGILCLPAGSYYLNNRENWPFDPAAIVIMYSNMTLWGAGRGKTILHTESVFAEHKRGHGIYISGNKTAPAQRNVTLRDFELDGGAGFTGCYSWVGDQPDCWDTTHKGIVVGWDALLDDVTLQDIYVHSYRGEILYTGGTGVGRVTVERVKSEDTNASTFNLYGAQLLVQNSEFGRARFWMELVALRNTAGYPANRMIFRNNYFHDNNADAGISITQGDGSTNEFIFENNRFARSSGILLGLFGGVGGPVYFTNNDIADVSSWILAFAASGKTPYNANLLFSRNVINRAFGLTYLEYSEIRNITISDNSFHGLSDKTPADSESFLYGSGANLSNITIINNEFNDCRKPRKTGPFSGDTPQLLNNRFVNCVN